MSDLQTLLQSVRQSIIGKKTSLSELFTSAKSDQTIVCLNIRDWCRLYDAFECSDAVETAEFNYTIFNFLWATKPSTSELKDQWKEIKQLIETLNSVKFTCMELESGLVLDLSPFKQLKRIEFSRILLNLIDIKNSLLVTDLVLTNCTITTDCLDAVNTCFTELTHFQISKCNLSNPLLAIALKTIPKTIKSLDLSNNQLTEFPSLHAFKLDSLDLSNNKISKLEEILALPTLSRLNIQNNSLDSVLGIEKFASLTSLNVSHNKIWDIYQLQSLSKLVSLTDLVVVGNPFTKVNGWESDLLNYFKLRALEMTLNGSKPSSEIRSSILSNNPIISLMKPDQGLKAVIESNDYTLDHRAEPVSIPIQKSHSPTTPASIGSYQTASSLLPTKFSLKYAEKVPIDALDTPAEPMKTVTLTSSIELKEPILEQKPKLKPAEPEPTPNSRSRSGTVNELMSIKIPKVKSELPVLEFTEKPVRKKVPQSLLSKNTYLLSKPKSSGSTTFSRSLHTETFDSNPFASPKYTEMNNSLEIYLQFNLFEENESLKQWIALSWTVQSSFSIQESRNQLGILVKNSFISIDRFCFQVPRQSPGYLLISSKRLLVFSPKRSLDSSKMSSIHYENPMDYLTISHSISFESIKRIDVGPNNQYFSVHFSRENLLVSLVLFTRNARFTMEFIEFIKPFCSINSKYEWFEKNLLLYEPQATMEYYQLVSLVTFANSLLSSIPCSMVLMNTKLYWFIERFDVWPPPFIPSEYTDSDNLNEKTRQFLNQEKGLVCDLIYPTSDYSLILQRNLDEIQRVERWKTWRWTSMDIHQNSNLLACSRLLNRGLIGTVSFDCSKVKRLVESNAAGWPWLVRLVTDTHIDLVFTNLKEADTFIDLVKSRNDLVQVVVGDD